MIHSEELTQNYANVLLKEKTDSGKMNAIRIIDSKLKEFSQTIVDGGYVSIDIHMNQVNKQSLESAVADYRSCGWYVSENWYPAGSRYFSNIYISKNPIIKPAPHSPIHIEEKKSIWKKLFSKA